MRNFIEDLAYVIGNTNISGKGDLQFPLVYSKAFGEMSVREIDLSERSKNSLGRARISTMQDLMNGFNAVAKIRNCGAKSAKEIKTGFLQRWYETLDDKQFVDFWEEFIIINSHG